MTWNWISTLAFFACWLLSLGVFEAIACLSKNPTVSAAVWHLQGGNPFRSLVLGAAYVLGAVLLFWHLFLRGNP